MELGDAVLAQEAQEREGREGGLVGRGGEGGGEGPGVVGREEREVALERGDVVGADREEGAELEDVACCGGRRLGRIERRSERERERERRGRTGCGEGALVELVRVWEQEAEVGEVDLELGEELLDGSLVERVGALVPLALEVRVELGGLGAHDGG